MTDQRLVNPVIAKKFSLEKVNDAVQFILDKKSTEKIIITMKND
jgi:D-arabinose 1-dehydrogenase-like Zn-dependent alcohol dehydrogenase